MGCLVLSETLKIEVNNSAVDRNSRRRKEERAGASKAKLKMRDHYTKVLVSLESYLKYPHTL